MDIKQQITSLIEAPFECADGEAQPKKMTIQSSPEMRNYLIKIKPDGVITILAEVCVRKFLPVYSSRLAMCGHIGKLIEDICNELETETELKEQIEKEGFHP